MPSCRGLAPPPRVPAVASCGADEDSSRPSRLCMSAGGPSEGTRRGLAGRVLGDRYRVVRMVSAGASTLIADAEDTELNRPVTVKLVRPEIAEADSSGAASRRRCGRWPSCRTPTSPPSTTGVRRRSGGAPTVYAVVEYLAGGSLRDLFDRGRRLDPSQALVVGLEACRGLDFAHRKSLVHGELTPSKLVFGDDRRLRIVDFGLARLLGADDWKEPSTVPDARRPLLLARAGAGPADRRPVGRLLAGAHPRRGGHRQRAVRGPLDRRHAVGACRSADAGVGRPRPAGRGARTGRPSRSGRPLDGGGARPQPRAGGREAAPPGADPAPRHVAFDDDPNRMRRPNDPTGGDRRPPPEPAQPLVPPPPAPEPADASRRGGGGRRRRCRRRSRPSWNRHCPRRPRNERPARRWLTPPSPPACVGHEPAVFGRRTRRATTATNVSTVRPPAATTATVGRRHGRARRR